MDIQAHPESDLHPAARFAMGRRVHQQFFKLYRKSVQYCYAIYGFFFLLLYSMATLIFQSKLQPTSDQSQTKTLLLSVQDYELIIYYMSQDLMKNDPLPPKINLNYGHNNHSISWMLNVIN